MNSKLRVLTYKVLKPYKLKISILSDLKPCFADVQTS